jgi:hypothetical protein
MKGTLPAAKREKPPHKSRQIIIEPQKDGRVTHQRMRRDGDLCNIAHVYPCQRGAKCKQRGTARSIVVAPGCTLGRSKTKWSREGRGAESKTEEEH